MWLPAAHLNSKLFADLVLLQLRYCTIPKLPKFAVIDEQHIEQPFVEHLLDRELEAAKARRLHSKMSTF